MSNFEVRVAKKDLAAFRRRIAYHYRKRPKAEYMEAIFVRMKDGQYEIVSFHRLWIDKRTRHEVESNDLQWTELQNRASLQGLQVGSIHTHTICDSAPSHADHINGIENHEPLMGVCEVDEVEGRLKTHIDFWIPQLPGKIKIIRK